MGWAASTVRPGLLGGQGGVAWDGLLIRSNDAAHAVAQDQDFGRCRGMRREQRLVSARCRNDGDDRRRTPPALPAPSAIDVTGESQGPWSHQRQPLGCIDPGWDQQT